MRTRLASGRQVPGVGEFAWRAVLATASAGGACGLWAIARLLARTAFFRGAPSVDVLSVLVLILLTLASAFCHFLGVRWFVCMMCLLGVLVLQRSELGQEALHHHGRTEHVRVLQVQDTSDGMGGGGVSYTVSVLDGPPLDPIPKPGLLDGGSRLGGGGWVPGGTYEVTVDPQGLAPVGRGGPPGPPVVQRLLQIPLGLGLALALWRFWYLLLRLRRWPWHDPWDVG
ncbi:hypothetical protein [Streptomyces sp. SPB162]|uniref:hypothetical protein n=1 Tax=Streptomyces sp. SPB162 TaxID=2940560 RepID=UPI002404E86C|nr:hypothetical protein [Streptomyces sp. SPB162]MDF9817083.1 hypothetical protein [Streptomyces sp. SPB162]